MKLPMEQRIDDLIAAARERDETLYQIMLRNAGWGIMWHDGKREDPGGRDGWRRQLVVYAYHPTLREALDAEAQRLGLSPRPPAGE